MSDYRRVETILMEVANVNLSGQTITLNNRRGSWIMEGTYPLDICPEPARVAGGAFYLDIFRRGDGKTSEYILRSRLVDVEEEREKLKEILGSPDAFPEQL